MVIVILQYQIRCRKYKWHLHSLAWNHTMCIKHLLMFSSLRQYYFNPCHVLRGLPFIVWMFIIKTIARSIHIENIRVWLPVRGDGQIILHNKKQWRGKLPRKHSKVYNNDAQRLPLFCLVYILCHCWLLIWHVIVQLQIGLFCQKWFWRPSNLLLVLIVLKHVWSQNPDDVTLFPLGKYLHTQIQNGRHVCTIFLIAIFSGTRNPMENTK